MGSGKVIYLNGNVLSSTTQTDTITANNNLWMGRRGATNYFQGSIADFRIYNRALSQAEVTALYELYE